MVTNAITSFEVKISNGEEILNRKKELLRLSKELSMVLQKEAKKSASESEKLEKLYKASQYAISEIEHRAEVFISEQILNEDKQRFEQMKVAEQQLLDRVALLPQLMESLKRKKAALHFKSDQQLKMESDDITSKYQDYVKNPTNEEGIKLVKRVDMAIFNIDNRNKR
jgi:hypothetical protein